MRNDSLVSVVSPWQNKEKSEVFDPATCQKKCFFNTHFLKIITNIFMFFLSRRMKHDQKSSKRYHVFFLNSAT